MYGINDGHLRQRHDGKTALNSQQGLSKGGYSFCNKPVENRDCGSDSGQTWWRTPLFDHSLSKGQGQQTTRGLNQFSGSAQGSQTPTSYQYGQLQNSSRYTAGGANGSFGATLPRSQVINPLFSPRFNNRLPYQDATEHNVRRENRSSPLNLQAKYSYSTEQLWPAVQNCRTASAISQQTTNSSLDSNQNQNGSFGSSASFRTKELEKDPSTNWGSHSKRRHSGDWTRQLGSLQSLHHLTPQRSILKLSSTPPTGQSVRFRKELEFSGVDGNLSLRSMDDTLDGKVVSISDTRLGIPASQKPSDLSPSTMKVLPQSINCTPATVTNASNSPKCQSYEDVTNWQYFFSKEHQELNKKCRPPKHDYRDVKEKTVSIATRSENVLKVLLLSFFVIAFGLYIILCIIG